jgi:hypothetical protein
MSLTKKISIPHLIIYLNKITDEEFIDHGQTKNDDAIYERRVRSLLANIRTMDSKLREQNLLNDENMFDEQNIEGFEIDGEEALILNMNVVKEKCFKSIIENASVEFSRRVILQEYFEKYFSGEGEAEVDDEFMHNVNMLGGGSEGELSEIMNLLGQIN